MSLLFRARPTLPLVVLLPLLGGCGGGSSGGEPADGPDAGLDEGPSERPIVEETGQGGDGDMVSMPVLSDPVTSSAALLALRADPARIAEVPDTALVERVESTGVEVAYTDLAQRESISSLSVSSQWEAMQACVGISAPAPLVLIAATVRPFFSTDDVLSDPFVGITASAGASEAGLLFIQVQESVFDEDRDDPGFPMRWIMTRHLWTSDDRPERDIPFLCARGGREERP